VKKVLLDTSVIIDFIRRKDKENTLLFSLSKKGYKLHISILTHTELYSGKSVWRSIEAEQDLEKLFYGMHILPLETEISKKAGEIRAKNNTTIIDAIISATAINHGLSLATLNLKDFEDIKGLNLLNNIN